MSISSISSLATNGLTGISQAAKTATAASAGSGTESVGDTFDKVLNSLNNSQQNADSLMTQLASGDNVDVSDVMIATTENDVNFRVAMAIRDKLISAYQEVMRMNV
jgi:flagellar hook-basal body complex protein FliE